jgi:hypothetical protein
MREFWEDRPVINFDLNPFITLVGKFDTCIVLFSAEYNFLFHDDINSEEQQILTGDNFK